MLGPDDAESVETREDFIRFARALSEEDSSRWENPQTVRYLEALSAWVEDSDRVQDASWKSFAMILLAATFYE